jgi:hypothetical protein
MDILEYFDYNSEVSLTSVYDQDCKSSPNSSNDLVKENEISEKVNIIKNVFCCFRKVEQDHETLVQNTDEDPDTDSEDSDSDLDSVDRTEVIPGVQVFGSINNITVGNIPRIEFDHDTLISISRRNSESNLLTEHYNSSRKSSIDSTFTFITMFEQERH